VANPAAYPPDANDASPAKRGRKRRPAIVAEALMGQRYLPVIQRYLDDLRKLYPHPNRVLFYDDLLVVYLLAFFNPTLRSLRCIEDASRLPGINAHLNTTAVCRSTLSDANALFDPAHLQGLIASLRKDLPNLHQMDPGLETLLKHVRVFDGSYFGVAADIQWALHQSKPDGKPMGQVRLDCQFCLRTGCPDGISIQGDDGVGEGAAAQQLLAEQQSPAGDCDPSIYLFDSGVVKFSYLREILRNRSHFLCNLREHIGFEAESEKRLSEADCQAGVQSDRIGRLRSSHAPQGVNAAPAVLLREVRIQYVDRHGQTRQLRLLSDLLELPAHLIAELYRQRWQVELFFRWLKVHAHFRHLTSHSRNGVTLGFHVALVAMLLTCLQTQAPLSKYGYNLLAMVAAGHGDVADILPILQRRERERLRERERQARKRAAKNKV
jgi:hypothetical protein